ncbi:MAG: hypothetical protein ACRD51_13685 [Candidatus Acidiferrum sp.]
MIRGQGCKERIALWMAGVAVFGCLSARSLFAQESQSVQKQKISEGQYVRLKDNLKVAGSEQNWILWRLPSGYELEDHFQSQGNPADQLLSQLRGANLSPELRKDLETAVAETDIVMRYGSNRRPQTLIVRGKKLLDGKAVEMVNCKVETHEVRCIGMGRHAKLHIQESEEFFYAFPFPMLLGEWFTSSTASAMESSLSTLAILDTPIESEYKPILAQAERNIQSEGDEALIIGDREFQAHKGKITLSYRDKNPLPLTIWYGGPGLVYALEGGGPAGERMALVQYKKYSDY